MKTKFRMTFCSKESTRSQNGLQVQHARIFANDWSLRDSSFKDDPAA